MSDCCQSWQCESHRRIEQALQWAQEAQGTGVTDLPKLMRILTITHERGSKGR